MLADRHEEGGLLATAAATVATPPGANLAVDAAGDQAAGPANCGVAKGAHARDVDPGAVVNPRKKLRNKKINVMQEFQPGKYP